MYEPSQEFFDSIGDAWGNTRRTEELALAEVRRQLKVWDEFFMMDVGVLIGSSQSLVNFTASFIELMNGELEK